MGKNFKKAVIMIKECIVMSIDNIWGNKVRSALTVLGILIGVTAVIALITTVSGFSGTLSSSFAGMGAGSLSVSITGSDLKEGLTPEDLNYLSDLDYVAGITPSVSARCRISKNGTYESRITVAGKSEYYFRHNADTVKRGRNLTFIDDDNKTNVCLISDDMVQEFFYGVDPIDQELNINGVSFTVVGLLNDDASTTVADMLSGTPDIMIPYTSAMRLNNVNVVTSFTVYLEDGIDSDTASSMLESELDAMFSYEDDTFEVTTMSSIEDTMESIMSMVSTLLAGIASIALVVGGIGIMNMMLTTVTERTAEIGLKKALGAFPWQIQIQFLIESFLLSMIGGLLGVVLGLSLSFILCKVMSITFTISTGAIMLGVSFSAAVGIIFGWAPARKASQLNPIDALRAM